MPARKKKRRTLTPFQLRMSRWLRAIGIANVVFQWEHDHTAYLEELEALIEGNIYAPKIRDDLVKRLYAEKKRCGMTMTKLIHMIVENALKDREQEILPEVHDARKPRKPASHARQRVPKETHGHHPLRHVMSIPPKTVFSPHRNHVNASGHNPARGCCSEWPTPRPFTWGDAPPCMSGLPT